MGEAAASTLNAIVPDNPATNMRRMPYRSPSVPAPNTAAAIVSVARLAMKLAVAGVAPSPIRTSDMLAARIVGSATGIA